MFLENGISLATKYAASNYVAFALNAAVFGSNTACFCSNAFPAYITVSALNSYSNATTPVLLATSNTAFAANTTAVYASNIAVNANSQLTSFSNWMAPQGTKWATNGNVVYTLSNVGIGTSSVDAGCSLKTAGGIVAYNCFIGDVGHGPSYAGWCRTGAITKSTTGYALLQDIGGYTFLNAASGQNIELRNGNNTRATISGTSSSFNGDFTVRDSFARVIGKVNKGILSIICEDAKSTAQVDWLVVAERKDDTLRDLNITDDNGKLKTQHKADMLLKKQPKGTSK